VLSDPADQLETTIVSRKDDVSPVTRAFGEAAQAAFALVDTRSL
jgi:hypothetical protein